MSRLAAVVTVAVMTSVAVTGWAATESGVEIPQGWAVTLVGLLVTALSLAVGLAAKLFRDKRQEESPVDRARYRAEAKKEADATHARIERDLKDVEQRAQAVIANMKEDLDHWRDDIHGQLEVLRGHHHSLRNELSTPLMKIAVLDERTGHMQKSLEEIKALIKSGRQYAG